MRNLTAFLAALGLSFALVLSAAQPGQAKIAGNWKLTFLDDNELVSLWLLKLEVKDGKIMGTLDAAPKAPPATVREAVLQGDNLVLTLDFSGQPLRVTVKAPQGESKRLLGSMTFQGMLYPARLDATKDDNAKGIEAITEVKIPKGEFKEMRDEVAKRSEDMGVFPIAARMLHMGCNEKVPPADLKAALSPALKAAGAYGDWLQDLQLKYARILIDHDGYVGLGEELAQQALKGFGAAADASTQLRCLDLIALSLQKQDKKADLAKLRTRIDELETKAHEENEKTGLGFVPDKAAGRKGKRVVLVELFTGAQCPPCVAADLAFEGLAKTYPTSEVVLLQYHLHIPRPDPMTSPDTIARAKYYGDEVRGTPSIFFNGKSTAGGGGMRAHAQAKYKDYRGVLDPLLNDNDKVALPGDAGRKPKDENQNDKNLITFRPFSKITLGVDAKRTGDAVTITATAADYKPGDKLKLRLALVEPWVRYPGSNGLSYHAHVVRALPGGVDGFTLNKESAKETAKVDLGELRQAADKHLQQYEPLNGQRPFNYRNLHLVAFVQDDETKEVLHAIEVPVK